MTSFQTGLHIAFGPMFAAKTNWLLQQLTTYADVGYKVCLINHADDIRKTEGSDRNVTTHSSQFKHLSHKITPFKTDSLRKVYMDEFDVIGIDEGQFFDGKDNGIPEIVTVVRDLIMKKKKLVFISSLDGDFRAQTFGYVHQLICICDPGGLHKFSAICNKCRDNKKLSRAGFTGKILPSKDGEVKDVGGADKYIALCLDCYRSS